MKNKTATLWPRIASGLLWLSPMSLLYVIISDWLFPFPCHLLFGLGIVWLLASLGGIYLTAKNTSCKSFAKIIAVSTLYSLYLISAFHGSDSAIRRDLAEVRIGSSAEGLQKRMLPYRETNFDGIYDEIFYPPENCDSFRAYYVLPPGADEACIVAFGLKKGKVIFRGISYEHRSLVYPAN